MNWRVDHLSPWKGHRLGVILGLPGYQCETIVLHGSNLTCSGAVGEVALTSKELVLTDHKVALVV